MSNFWTSLTAVLSICLGFITPMTMGLANAQETTSKNNLTIDYIDYNHILKGLVLAKMPTSRMAPLRSAPPIGTRISFVNKKKTRLEGNRVMFHYLKSEDKVIIRQVREGLEALPSHYPLNTFSKNEQLAYWLNLRNITVIEAIMDKYPIRRLKKFWRKIENEKRVTVAGQPMSINDIETLVITKWPKAQVIYGFYNGAIGGPNIRERAYTGSTVWSALSSNTKEFVNSLRGIQFTKKSTLLSDFYNRYPTLFPDFKTDLQNHVRRNLSSNLVYKMDNTKTLKLSIHDWHIADLMNGRLGLSSAGSIGPAALVFGMTCVGSCDFKNKIIAGSMKELGLQRYPAHVQAYLRGMQQRRREVEHGIVTIEEVDGNERDVTIKKEKQK